MSSDLIDTLYLESTRERERKRERERERERARERERERETKKEQAVRSDARVWLCICDYSLYKHTDESFVLEINHAGRVCHQVVFAQTPAALDDSSGLFAEESRINMALFHKTLNH